MTSINSECVKLMDNNHQLCDALCVYVCVCERERERERAVMSE